MEWFGLNINDNNNGALAISAPETNGTSDGLFLYFMFDFILLLFN